MFCPKCGAQNPDGAKFCGSCGAAQSAGAPAAAPSATPPSAATKPSGKKSFPKAIIAAVAAIAAIAIVAFAAVNFLAPKGFNGTVTVTEYYGESSVGSIRTTVKDDSVTVENLYSDGEVNDAVSYSATIAERSETENTYIFALKDAKWMNGDRFLASGDWDSGDNKLTLFIPKGLKSQNPEGYFGATLLNMAKDGTYGFATNDLCSPKLMEFDSSGTGRSFLAIGLHMDSAEEASKIDPTSDAYDEGYGSPDTIAKSEDSFSWEKNEDAVHVTWEDSSASYDAVDISVTE